MRRLVVCEPCVGQGCSASGAEGSREESPGGWCCVEVKAVAPDECVAGQVHMAMMVMMVVMMRCHAC